MIFLIANQAKHKTITLAFALLLWEILEIIFLKIQFNIFVPEILTDQLTDVIVGFLPGFLTLYLINKKNLFSKVKIINPNFLSAIFVSLMVAFIWVGTYHYHYSRIEFNSPGVNYWALLLWFFGYMAILKFYSFLESKFNKIYISIPVLWITYFFVLFVIEYIGRYVVEIKEVSSPTNQPLIFGLIYGTPTLHFVYTFAPIIAIIFYLPIRKLFKQTVINN